MTTECKTTSPSGRVWGEMTREEKGELLLAHHEGKVLQLLTGYNEWIDVEEPLFVRTFPYRVKPEPKAETLAIYGAVESSGYYCFGPKLKSLDTHKITFDVVDGKVDCNSVRMGEL